MDLQVYELNIQASDALRSHVERRFHAALARIVRRVDAVVVRCADVNGHRGGHDKKCDVQVQLAGGQAVRLRETDRSLYRAVDRAAKRVRRVVKNRLGRQRTRKRSGPRRRPDRPEMPSALSAGALSQALA